MPLGDILKRHAKQFISGTPRTQRDMPSLADELQDEFRTAQQRAIQRAVDPDREQREAAERASELEEIRSQAGFGQMVTIDGYRGRWEAVELMVGETDTATFSLVDRESGAVAQLGADDSGSLVLDVPDDQFSGRAEGAFWHDGSSVGIRLVGIELTSDRRRVSVSCDLRAPV